MRPSKSQGIVSIIVLTLASACSSGSTGPKSTILKGADTSKANALETSYETVVKSVGPSVVEIKTDTGLGSGVVYDKAGDIVTNAHVVGTSTRFVVSYGNGRTTGAALVGAYPPDDLAVIRVEGGDVPQPASFADSRKVQVGQIVLAIGNPLGLASSVTDGIVSFNGRTVSEGDGIVLPNTIQTSAPINPGNSGGALVDTEGSVIGIPTLAAIDPELNGGVAPGIGFAIPSSTVRTIADQLVKDGKVTHSGRAALGVAATDVVDPNGHPVGVLVRAVAANSPAAKAGVSPGDVITAIDGKPTPDLGTLAEVLVGYQPGDKVTLDVLGVDGTRRTVEVTLGDLSG